MARKRDHDGDNSLGDVCPHCGEQGFDGQGKTKVEDELMYKKQCWNCGTTFCVQLPLHRPSIDV